ncbi:MAG: hypothetical protein GC159_06920 [Phycisphaera sp.]|nr:hypothetical protein [Phycisphaera sp.]
MADLLKRGSDWLQQMRTAHMTSPVEYQRATEPPQVLMVNATFGQTRYEVVDETGLTVGSHVWDFLILAADLGVEPTPADVIVANGRKYEVMNFGTERAWRWSDPYRTTYRIHTRDIGAAT